MDCSHKKSKGLIGFKVTREDIRYFENLYKKVAHVKPKKHATDCYTLYGSINPAK